MLDRVAILHDDGDLVVADKPSGLLYHRNEAECDDRVFLLQAVRDRVGRRVYPVHRLDRATSGITLFGGHPEAARRLSDTLAAGGIEKTYLALVKGAPPDRGVIDLPLTDRATGTLQSARTTFRTFARGEGCALVLCRPATGRRHQIRRHMKKIHHPILGDTSYGSGRDNRPAREAFGLRRLALHSLHLRLPHPATGARLSFAAPLPPDLALPLARIPGLAAAAVTLADPADPAFAEVLAAF